MIRCAFMSPCIGVGGGDGFMQSLIRHTTPPFGNLDWKGVIVVNGFDTRSQYSGLYQMGNICPIYLGRDSYNIDKGEYVPAKAAHLVINDKLEDSIHTCLKDVDVLINWGHSSHYLLRHLLYGRTFIELTQNEDVFAKGCVTHCLDLNLYSHCVAVSKSSARVFEGHKNSPAEVKILYNAIEPGRLIPKRPRSVSRAAYNLADDTRVILSAARPVPEKNLESLFDAMKYLPSNYVVLVIGQAYQDEYYKHLQLYAARHCPGRVMFIAEHPYFMGDIYNLADCFYLLSDYEGLSLGLMEAMYAGLSCVYSDHNAICELESQFGPLGYMVPRRSSGENIANSILSACSASPETLKRMSTAYDMVSNNMLINNLAGQWEDYITEVHTNTLRSHLRLPPGTIIAGQDFHHYTPPNLFGQPSPMRPQLSMPNLRTNTRSPHTTPLGSCSPSEILIPPAQSHSPNIDTDTEQQPDRARQ